MRETDGKERLFTLAEQARVKQCDPSLVEGASFTTGTEALGQGIDMGQGWGVAEMIAQCVLNPLRGVGRAVSALPVLQVAEDLPGEEDWEDGEHQMVLFG